jgi:PAT family beta-lactamase induction signal transducer AmpG
MMSGAISDYLGYAHFFIWVLISTLPAFLVSWLVPLQKQAPDQES